MTIARSTEAQAYQLNKGGTPARMAILRMMAADSANSPNEATRLQPGDWKGARHWGLHSWEAAFCAGLDQGFNGDGPHKTPIWYTHDGAQFRDEKFADKCEGGPDHTGWFTDTDQSEKARGIVGRLTHGRFIAGYHWSSNGERVYFPEVFSDEGDAAQMADEHARVFSELAYEDNQRFENMSLCELDCEEKLTEVQKAFALRHRPKFGGADRVHDAIEELRSSRDALSEATAAYERG